MSAFDRYENIPEEVKEDDNGFEFHMNELHTKFPHLWNVTKTENMYRKKIATGSARLTEGLIHLTPEILEKTTLLECPSDIERLLPSVNRPHKEGKAFSVTKEQLDPKIYEILDIPNVVIAGGFVVKQLTCKPYDDIDLFIWGVSEEEAQKKIEKICDIIHNKFVNKFAGNDPYALYMYNGFGFRTGHAITFNFGLLKIQVILRLYKSPAEILYGFDIPSCKVLMVTNPEKKVEYWCTESFLTCMMYKSIWTDPERQSKTYILRLYKYWTKGFNVLLIGLNRDKVNPKIYTTPFKDLKGMARLIRSEQLIIDMSKYGGPYHFSFIKKILCNRYETPESDYMEQTINTNGLVRLEKDYFFFSTPASFKEALGGIIWVTEDPGSQTVIGSFHPENEKFFDKLY